MGSQVDDALDRLARLRVMLVGVLNDARPSPDWSWEILHAWDAMCEERERLRAERDAAKRELREFEHVDGEPLYETAAVAASSFVFARHRAESAEAEVRQLREERDALEAARYQTDDSPHNRERPRDDGTPGATT